MIEVDAYRATLPTDPAPAYDLIDAACTGTLRVVTFTTALALHNLFVLADAHGRAEELRLAFNGPVVAACVGPVCAQGACEEDIEAPLLPPRGAPCPPCASSDRSVVASSVNAVGRSLRCFVSDQARGRRSGQVTGWGT